MTKISFTFFLFALLTNVKYSEPKVDPKDYCKLTCKIDDQRVMNTACRRKDVKCGIAGKCKYVKSDQTFRELMVHQHNDYRNKIANGTEKRGTNTGATNMQSISYDLELEFLVQCHLNECVFDHDKCRRSKKFYSVGQNLYRSNKEFNWAMHGWYDTEIGQFKGPLDKYVFEHETGHYTQIVWALTTLVGCARARGGDIDYRIVGCNYAPSGNTEGQVVYKPGPGASECKTVNKKYPALCGDEIIIPTDEPWLEELWSTEVLGHGPGGGHGDNSTAGNKTSSDDNTVYYSYKMQLTHFSWICLSMIVYLTWIL